MTINKIDALKGFMPQHEGVALQKWSAIFSLHGSVVEIGTYGGKSSLYLASGAKKNDQIVFTIDHHYGSEEHQIDQEYFDESNYDKSLGRVNTVPLLQKNLSKVKEIKNIIQYFINLNENISFILHSQVAVADFYASINFISYGDEFFEDEIPHIAMRYKKTKI